jgi:hypothetical protein
MDDAQLKATLAEVERFGSLECVLYNAARVSGKPPLEEAVEEMERDFKVREKFCFLLPVLSP